MTTKARSEALAPLFDNAAAGIRVAALASGRRVRVVLPEARVAERLCGVLLSLGRARYAIATASAAPSGSAFTVAATFAGNRDQRAALERFLVGFAVAAACSAVPAPAPVV